MISPHDIRKMAQQLAELERDIPGGDRERNRLLLDLRNGDEEAARDLQKLVDWRRAMVDSLQALELALKNSAASFARFDQKAAKDAALLLEARKRRGGSGFDDKHPLLEMQRQCIARVEQKLTFFANELYKVKEVLGKQNYKAPVGVRELEKLASALERDDLLFEERSALDDTRRALRDMLELHHLRS